MKVGDLVKDYWSNQIGIIIWQVGCVDRWMVYWADGDKQGYNGCNLELL